MGQGVRVRFRGGPLDGESRWFELLVDPDGRPHEQLARRNRRDGCREVYRLASGPNDDGSWDFTFVGVEPLAL
jgi:hypothetical protein